MEKPGAGEADFILKISMTFWLDLTYRVPYPEAHAKLYFRDSEEDIDRQKPILRYPPQSVFIVGDSGSVEPAGITLVSWKAIPSRSSLTNIAGERKRQAVIISLRISAL